MHKSDFFELLKTEQGLAKVWEFENENIVVTRYQLGETNTALIVEDHTNGKGTFFYFPEYITAGKHLICWEDTYAFIKEKYNDQESEKVG